MMEKPKYNTLREFLDAHARGEIPEDAQVINWTTNDSVTVEVEQDDQRVVFYRASTCPEFVLDFAKAMGLEGFIA